MRVTDPLLEQINFICGDDGMTIAPQDDGEWSCEQWRRPKKAGWGATIDEAIHDCYAQLLREKS